MYFCAVTATSPCDWCLDLAVIDNMLCTGPYRLSLCCMGMVCCYASPSRTVWSSRWCLNDSAVGGGRWPPLKSHRFDTERLCARLSRHNLLVNALRNEQDSRQMRCLRDFKCKMVARCFESNASSTEGRCSEQAAKRKKRTATWKYKIKTYSRNTAKRVQSIAQ